MPRRLLVTIAVPLLLWLASELLPLPGVPLDLFAHIPPSDHVQELVRSTFAKPGVFALGITPIITAYVIVEIIAFFVPPLSRLRHHPEGRAKLERAVRLVAIITAGIQAWAMTAAILALADSDHTGRAALEASTLAMPVMGASLLGGVCIQFLAARFVTRHGLLNGLVALSVVPVVRMLVASLSKPLASRALATDALAIASVVVATWALLRDGESAGGAIATEERGMGSRYRAARELVVRPRFPLPSSSVEPYFAAATLLAIPAAIAFLAPPLGAAAEALRGETLFAAVAAVTAMLVVVFAFLMHRPEETADLASHLGVTKKRKKKQSEARAALLKTLVPTTAFFVVLVIASRVGPFGIQFVPLLVAAFVDLARAMRSERASSELVPIWEERRASAVPVLRAALAADGVAVDVRGTAVLGLLQVFAPYAPAILRVKKDDEERATETLRHVVSGDPAPEERDVASDASRDAAAVAAAPPPWSVARRALVLGACAAVAMGAVLIERAGSAGDHEAASQPTMPRARLEVVYVDDTIDPFADVREESLPDNAGMSIQSEIAPLPNHKTVRVHFARMMFREGETRASARSRFDAWLATIAVEREGRFGVAEITERAEDGTKSSAVGLRTYVLVGEPILRTEDVLDASAATTMRAGVDETYVAVTLAPDATKRFEDATRAWSGRRMAIVLDDEINSAPIIKSPIAGGRMSITMGAADAEEQRAREATELARRLRGK